LKTSWSVWLVVVAVTLAAACGGGGGQQSSSSAPPPSANSAPASSAAATGAPAAASGEPEFGVAECDDYMKKYMACIDKMPEAARAASRQALDQQKAAWKQAAASSPEAKNALATGCKSASDAAKQAMASYNCWQ
jgi:hypothetical protein